MERKFTKEEAKSAKAWWDKKPLEERLKLMPINEAKVVAMYLSEVESSNTHTFGELQSVNKYDLDQLEYEAKRREQIDETMQKVRDVSDKVAGVQEARKVLNNYESLPGRLYDCVAYSEYTVLKAIQSVLSPSTLESVEEAAQLFDNNSDCYADTWTFDKQTGKHKEGIVIQAMTKEKFIEVFSQSNKQVQELREAKWIDVNEQLPEEGGRYWCYVEEINDLGKSHFQWNCSYDEICKTFSDKYLKGGKVTHWMPLPSSPNTTTKNTYNQ